MVAVSQKETKVYGDFSRVLDRISGEYSAVLAQQGRFVLDADLNAQSAIVLDYLRELTTDLLGPFAGPSDGVGFAVEPVPHEHRRVRLGPGRYYVYGLRCELPSRHWRSEDELHVGEHHEAHLIYLLVWEQSVSAIQEPAIIDPGLREELTGTTRRREVRWRPMTGRRAPWLELAPTPSADNVDSEDAVPRPAATLTPDQVEAIASEFDEYNSDPSRRPTLAAAAGPSPPGDGPDTSAAAGGYRNVENQLYRVEVHRGGDADHATFKWSRDNGSVEFGLEGLEESGDGERTAILQRVPDPAAPSLEIGDWVEYVDDSWAPVGHPTTLLQVTELSFAARRVTLRDVEAEPRRFDRALHPLLRRWDQTDRCDEHGIAIQTADGGRWFELEDGVWITFEAETPRYERGDYWLIPARTATSGVLWPESNGVPEAVTPNGPARYLAPLAMRTDEGWKDLRLCFDAQSDRVPVTAAAAMAPQQGGATPTGAASGSAETGEIASPVSDPEPERGQQADSKDRVGFERQAVEHAEGMVSSIEHKLGEVTHELEGVGHRLRSIGEVSSGNVFVIDKETKVGRGNGSDLPIDHPDVSPNHAVLELEASHLTVTDVGSTNGTKVNDHPLEPHVPRRLDPGDRVQFGSPDVLLEYEEVRS
jgi:hypothetical protein